MLVDNCGVTPHLAVACLPQNLVYANTLAVFSYERMSALSAIQSRPHEVWARFFASSLKDVSATHPPTASRPSPFPRGFETSPTLEAAGQAYHDHRAALMVARNEGMTKTYNRFHDPDERREDIVRLRELHAEMDRAVLRAYGWDDLADARRADLPRRDQ